MAVTDPTRSVTANGNDVATVFPFNPMEIYDSTQLSVYKTDVAGVITLLAEGVSATTYSVSVASYPGTGSITYPASGGTPLATGEVITIIRELPIEQTLVLNNQGGYFPEDVEDALDKLTMIALQLQEQLDRAVLVPAGDDTDPQDLIDDLIAASAAAVAAAALVAGVGLVQATETQIGIAEVATQAEVTTGSSDLQYITPLKFATGLTNRLASQAQAEAGAVNTNASLMTPLRTAQAIAVLAPAPAAPKFVDRYYSEYVANTDLTTVIPLDDTIPTSTEGTQILSQGVTTTTATQRVRVRFSGKISGGSIGQTAAFAIFRGTTCIGASSCVFANANYPLRVGMDVEEVPGVGTFTYTVRVGPDTGTLRMNGSNAARQFGGADRATLVIDLLEP